MTFKSRGLFHFSPTWFDPMKGYNQYYGLVTYMKCLLTTSIANSFDKTNTGCIYNFVPFVDASCVLDRIRSRRRDGQGTIAVKKREACSNMSAKGGEWKYRRE